MPETNQTASQSQAQPSRRDFIKRSTAAGVGAALVTQSLATAVYAQGSDMIKVGLVGCGERGTGAAAQALQADPGAKLVAMGDLFPDQIVNTKPSGALENLQAIEDISERIDVPKDRQFTGWDSYKGVIANSDVVLLATTPHWRPLHLKACIEAGKHIFCEKPVGIDARSVREVMDLAKTAESKKLNLVSGLCFRYDKYVKETMDQVHEGKIGEIVALNANYLTSWLWSKPRKPEWGDMEYQVRNWLYYYWLSGDHVVEQHIHSIDKALWAMKDVPPTRATSTGGRTQRTAPQFGNIYDHFGTVFEWERPGADPVRCFSYCRQYDGSATDVSDWVYGTKGAARLDQHYILSGGKKVWKRSPTTPEDKYVSEHKALFGAIRSGKTLNNGDYMCKSTMMAIMARESAYSGKTITWEEIMESKQDLTPQGGYAWQKTLAVAPVAVPTQYKFV